MNKKKLLILGIILYIFVVLVFLWDEVVRSRKVLFSEVDAKLRNGAIATKYILPQKFQTMGHNNESISPSLERYYVIELSKYAKEIGVKYLYSFILKDKKVYYTITSATDEEIASDDIFFYLEEYPEASEELKQLFSAPNQELIETERDRWGYFRSILKSHSTVNGIIYVSGADIEVEVIRRTFIISILRSLIFAISLLLIIIPIIIQYEKINKLQTDETLSKEKLKKMEFDEVTGLPYAEKLWIENQNYSNPVIFIITLTNLKTLNTHYGNEITYKLFNYLSIILSKLRIFENEYKLYKFGIEEFVLIIDEKKNYDEINLYCERIFDEIYSKPFMFNNEKVIINPVIGTSVLDHCDDNCIKNSFLNSSLALDYAQEHNMRYFVFNSLSKKDLANVENEILWCQKLWDAVNENRIKPFFQAIVNTSNGKVEKYESLMRLYEKDGKILGPFAFLSISHKTGQYFKLSENMINNTFEFFKDKKVTFSINLSAKDITDENIRRVILKKVIGFPNPNYIIFEIIESEGIDDYEELVNFIKNIRGLGCKIAIDDFGSGYSNFDRISKLPLDFIKIDGSLIKNITTNKSNEILVHMIVKTAKRLEIKTVAEFVHSEEVYKKVKEMGIDYAQGYYISEPLPSLLPDDFSIEV